MNVVLTVTKGVARARFNIGGEVVALAFATWLSAHGWSVEMWRTGEPVYLDELELCWNKTLCEQYANHLESRKVSA